MIGIECILVWLAPLGFLILGTVLLVAQRGRDLSAGLFCMGLCAVSLLVLISGLKVFDHLAFHWKLISLVPADVVSINVSHQTYTQPEQIASIIRAIQQSEWFETNHGGWNTLVPLTINFKLGSEFHCNIAYYRRRGGAVILSGNNTYHGSMDFSPRLPDVLKRLGFNLPVAEDDRQRYYPSFP